MLEAEAPSSCLPCGFLPLRRLPGVGQPLAPRVTMPRDTVPSRRFSRPQGLHPSAACRPYFMPVPPMGFSPRRIFLASRAVGPLEPRCPLVVRPPGAFCLDSRTSGSPRSIEPFGPVALVRQRYSVLAPLQGLHLCPRPSCLPVVRPNRQPQPSVRFLPRGFSLSAGGSS